MGKKECYIADNQIVFVESRVYKMIKYWGKYLNFSTKLYWSLCRTCFANKIILSDFDGIEACIFWICQFFFIQELLNATFLH